MEIQIGSNVKTLLLQFSFSNIDNVPTSLWDVKSESKEESVERNKRNKSAGGRTGTRSIELIKEPYPTEVILAGLPEDLAEGGWVMVEALYQPRRNIHSPGQIYHAVRFLFVPKRFHEKDDQQQIEFKRFRPVAYAELVGMVNLALWRVRAFKNPSYANGAEIANLFSVSVNFEGRVPLFSSDGSPALGEGSQPIKPHSVLRLIGDKLCLSNSSH
jgi:hypothetical protein